MRTDRFALADPGQQDRLDEIVTDAARGLEDTFDVNGVLSRNRRNFRHPSSSPATSSSRSIILPSLWKV